MKSIAIRNYALAALEGNARVLAFLLRDVELGSPRWDARPDPERFTLREIVAHLAEYDEVSRERFEKMIREENPSFPDWDPDQAARHYAQRDPKHQLKLLLESRHELRAWLAGLAEHEWKCLGTRPRVGEFSVEDGVTLLLVHDGYHLEQVVSWLGQTPA